MDDKVSRHKKFEIPRRRWQYTYGQALRYGRQIGRALYTHKSFLITICLFFVSGLLLFALVSQLPTPTTNTVPAGETEIAYSTFLAQVQTGNVQAVALQDTTLNGLLAHPLASQTTEVTQSSTQLPSTTALEPDPETWLSAQRAGASVANARVSAGIERTIFVRIPAGMSESLVNLLTAHHVLFTTLPPMLNLAWLATLWRMLPLILLIGLLLFLMLRPNPLSSRAIDDRVSQLGKSRARRFERAKERSEGSSSSMVEAEKHKTTNKKAASADATLPVSTASARVLTPPQVTFEDVAGIDEARADLMEIVEFLRTPERFTRLGARIPRGALLVGPPGTGKTLLAKAVAGEAGVPFFSMSASEFVEMFVGIGASRVRDLFNQARKSSPCVVFIDEIDAVGRKRSMRATGNDERDQTLNQLLVELDGFDTHYAIVVLAATNRVDILDTALLRPGRFDRQITVSPPDRAGREAILMVHTRNVPLHENVDLTQFARMTPGMTGADLANLVNEAALSAARHDLETVDTRCFEEALARVQLGALRPLVMSEQEKRVIAVHESGHALVAHHLPKADMVNRVTILPRGQSLGVTQFISETDRYNYSREVLMTRIAVALGGRAAEELVFGPERVTTGAENDLQVVTSLAHRMVTRWGMSERIGVVFADNTPELNYSAYSRINPDVWPASSLVARPDGSVQFNGALPPPPQALALTSATFSGKNGGMLNSLIDAEVRRIIHDGYALAHTILTEHIAQLTLLTETLIECEQLDRQQFEALVQEKKR